MKKFQYNFNFCKEVYEKIMQDTTLNKNEKECLKYLVQGYNSKEIAQKIKCAESTIWNRRRTIYQKLQLNIIQPLNIDKFCIYILLFPNKKVYVGKTKNPQKRWNNGEGYKENKEMYEDIQKYGWNNIEKKILYRNLNEKEAKLKENETIVIYKSFIDDYGYNKSITN